MSSAIGSADNYARWIVDFFKPHIGQTIIEVGAGYGNYKPLMPPSERHTFIDVDAAAIANAKQQYPGEEFIHGSITDPEMVAGLGNEQFDTVICFNVLEHIEADEKAVANMLSILQPGGKLLLFVPAFPALYSDMDRLAGHCRRYTKKTLTKVVGTGQGSITEMSYFNPIGGVGWWVNKFFSHSSLNDAAVNRQIIFFDRYILPLSRLLNGLTKGFFGQSLVCVIEKTKG